MPRAPSFVLMHPTKDKGVARLETLEHVDDPHRLKHGRECKKGWPAKAAFPMSSDFKKDTKLADYMKNIHMVMCVSERFRDVLAGVSGALAYSEVLPVAIVNHKGKREAAPYFIVNQIDTVPCLDEKKTKGSRSTLDPAVFQFIDKMVVDESKIPKGRLLVRPSQYWRYPLVHRELAAALTDAKLTGVGFTDPATFPF